MGRKDGGISLNSNYYSAQLFLQLSNSAPRRYANKIQDYNFGSLIRTDAREEYGETNTIFGSCTRSTMATCTYLLLVTRIQVRAD